MAEIVLNKLRKTFEGVDVVKDIDLVIQDKEFLVLVGPSGCGKTTTLRMVAGLERADSGEVLIDGSVVNGVPARDRDVAMVFQNYALFPHMTVFQNMAFGLWLRGTPKAEIERRVKEASAVLNIDSLLARRPKQLSGGQRQRVAMGRAMVRNPRAFLFDEPLSNLDAKLRVSMRTELKKLHGRLRTTIAYVTHDQVEAMTLADRIVVMNEGRIEQVGTPHELYEQPQTRFVATFIGSPSMNLIGGRLERDGESLLIEFGKDLVLTVPPTLAGRLSRWTGRDMIFGIRPEHITEKRPKARPTQVDFTARIDVVEPMGNDTMVYFCANGVDVCARSDPKAVSVPGSGMAFSVDLSHLHVIDPATNRVVKDRGQEAA